MTIKLYGTMIPRKIYHIGFESKLVFLIGMIQFINILDFMMVMPLGPDYARALAIPAEHIGTIGGTYTFAAAIAGLAGALFLDRFDRKRALLFLLFGLMLATACGALAWDLPSLVVARALAGMFGGPLTSVAIAMIADYVPPERRGAAMGKVMGAFAAASVLGVPFGLELARLFGWQTPFLALAAIAAAVMALAMAFLPGGKNIKNDARLSVQISYIVGCLRNPTALAAFALMGLSMMSGFMIIPNFSAHLQMNLDYPREHLGLLYFCGGIISFFSMRWVGKWIDKTTATHAAVGSTILFLAVTAVGLVWYHNPVPAVVIFVLFMVAMSSRSVAAQTIASKVPKADERGSYMSLQSAVTHMSSAIGAFMSSHILTHSVDNKLLGIDHLGLLAMGLSLFVPFLFYVTERRLHISRGHPVPDPSSLA